MTRRTPGRTAGFDNRRSTRSPFAYLSNTPITGQDRQYRHTGRNTPTALVIITKCGAEPLTAESHNLGHRRGRRPASGPDSRALSLIAHGVVGSIESHLFTPEDHSPQTLRPPASLRAQRSTGTHAAAVLAMHREHDGRVLGT